jgi:hypothetical protein
MNSSFLRGVVATGVPFGMGIYFSFRYGIPRGALAGFASGIFFGLAMTLFAQKQRERMGAKGGVFEGEDVLHEGPANHFKRAEGRGGWLTLTANKLSFRSHGKSIQNQPVDINLSDILNLKLTRTLGIVPNGFCVTRMDGTADRFVVTGRSEWLRIVSAHLPG